MSADTDGVAPVRSSRSDSTLAALRDRNFYPYFAGNLLSGCGTWFHNIAQTLLVYRLTGSLFLVGVVNLAQFAGVLVLGASAGVAADRFDRRRLILATQIASAAISATLALLAASDHINVTILIAAALMLGVSQTYSTPAMLAVVPQLVEPANLAPAVALNIITFNVARAVGPVLGAVVVDQLGAAAAFGLNALSFVALIAGLLMVTPRPVVGRDPRQRLRLRDTVRSLRVRKHLAALFLVGMCASMSIDPVTTLSPGFATRVFHRPDTLVGWFAGAFGLGAVLAGVRVSRQSHATDAVLAKRMGLLVLAMAAFASTNVLAVGILALVLAGFAFIGTVAAALTRVQQTTESIEHGRLMAVWSMALMGSRPIASVIDGAIASATSVRLATWLMLIPAVVGCLLMLSRARADRRASDA